MEFQSVTLYLTDFSAAEVSQLDSFKQYSDSLSELELAGDWQLEFAQQIGIDGYSIPWNLLRASHFNLPKNTRTIVCCDPVLMQMTHRGAYLWGQQGIDFSQEEVIRIIANINEKLMQPGESFYLLNERQWLFVSDKEIELNLPSFESYIGKDMFGFSYSGKDGVWWDKLATEIQMLIKQMIDFQGLRTVAAEHLINVHFWGNTKSRLPSEITPSLRPSHWIVSNDSQMESLSHFYKIKYKPIEQLHQVINEPRQQACQLSVVLSNQQGLDLDSVFERLLQLVNQNQLQEFKVITANKQILFKAKQSFWRKLFGFSKLKGLS
jgi:hypothetical protein